jgi:hypothetical protein
MEAIKNMECLESKDTINSTFEVVRDVSYTEKRLKVPTEEEINKFLDNILELQKLLGNKADKIEMVNSLLEKITWLNNINDDCLLQINTLIGVAKDFHSTLIRQYIKLNFLRSKGIAKQAIKDFKYSIDTLRDAISDLESVFFSLPNIPEYNDITKELSLL